MNHIVEPVGIRATVLRSSYADSSGKSSGHDRGSGKSSGHDRAVQHHLTVITVFNAACARNIFAIYLYTTVFLVSNIMFILEEMENLYK